MKILRYGFWLVLLTVALNACATDSAEETTATPDQPAQPAQPTAASPAPAGPRTAKAAPAAISKPAPPRPEPAPKLTEIPAGTSLSVILIDSISTGRNKAGDQFMASLAEPIMVDGYTLVEKGTKVQGRVVDAESSGRVSGRANIRMVLTAIVDAEKSYPIVTKPFVAEAEATKGRDAGIIGGAAGVGAAIGAIAGGKKGAATGAAIGGGAGTGTVLATKGKEVEFDSESKLTFTLERAAELPRMVGRIS